MNTIQWVGSPNHYQGRNGDHITHITLHIMVGHLAGTDNVFTQASSQASAHYGIGADGTIHQYVSETDGSWSDANFTSNNTTISIEHEGGMNGIPCTQACMDTSAALCADIARRQGWTHLWHDGLKGNIWLHREIPGTDHAGCPDLAPNGLDVQYVINKANQILKGDDMSAEDVWNFDQNGVKMRDRMQGTDAAANETRTELFRLSQWDDNTHASPLGNLVIEQPVQGGAKLGDRVADIDNKTSQLITQIAALTAAVKALSESIGANPDTIAKTVQDAVKAKLDSLKITVTNKQ